MNVSRARFTHSRQNGTLAESRSEEGSLTGSSAQPDTWRIPHSSPPFQPGTHAYFVFQLQAVVIFTQYKDFSRFR